MYKTMKVTILSMVNSITDDLCFKSDCLVFMEWYWCI